MAITKIHPIKSTLKKAIDYIADPAKTDDKLLVSSFGCAVETADLEFEKTRLLAMQKGNNFAHHLIQAFEPGEVSYAQAHEIGRRLADEILGGKYEYVIATHINKEHCHNHIIFCAVDFAEHKKYVSNRKATRRSAASATGCVGKMAVRCHARRGARQAVRRMGRAAERDKLQAKAENRHRQAYSHFQRP